MMQRTALISVSDRSGLVEFAQGLQRLGFQLLTTSGSGAFLAQHGISSQGIDQYTGQAEIFGGRVKTLHPMIYAGILARREVPQDMEMLARDGIRPIDVVAVNLYPFRDALGRLGKGHEMSESEMIELIDIGGPSMIRAASKNHQSVLPLIDPNDYTLGLELLEGRLSADQERGVRRGLAAKVFATLSDDGIAVASYLSSDRPLGEAPTRQLELPQQCESSSAAPTEESQPLPAWNGVVLRRDATLRYGENPHQKALFLRAMSSLASASPWSVFGGKALSYNNLLDVDAMVRMLHACRDDDQGVTAVIVKHLNPCGAARGPDALTAIQRAKRSDPRSHFGGIIGFSAAVSTEAAKAIREDFAEVVVAPAYDAEALALLLQNKNLRVIQADVAALAHGRELRSVLDGFLVQGRDEVVSSSREWEQVSGAAVSASVRSDLEFAWRVCSQVKSNAIVIVKDQMVIAVGAGQMSRIDSVEVALAKARLHQHDLRGAVAASDAFFPFPDGVETLGKSGVSAIVAPRGAKRDEEVRAAAAAHSAALCFAPERHFRH